MAGGERIEGLYLINKPAGPTSHDIVEEARRVLGIKRVGHAGTLDPFADGLLILLTGKGTRLAEYVKGYDKAYRGTIRLGVTTDTDDITGETIDERNVPDISRADLEGILNRFCGRIRQRVPRYSAVKVEGERLYKLARRGAEVGSPTREVYIYTLSVTFWEPPAVGFEFLCSSGTYARALARDIGEAVGCGGHLAALTRNAVGPYLLADAAAVQELVGVVHGRVRARAFVAMVEALPDFPTAEIRGDALSDITHGRSVPSPFAGLPDGNMVKLVARGLLVAVGRIDGELVRPLKVFVN